MTEVFREPAEFDPASNIAAALHDWLKAEVKSSTEGRNAILDDWHSFQHDLQLPFGDSSNQDAGEVRSDYDLLVNWSLGAELYPDLVNDDYYLARQTFCAQTALSGAYRKQCFMQAVSPDDYVLRRTRTGPVGINLHQVVARRLKEHGSSRGIPGFSYKDTPWANLLENTLRTNDERLEIAQEMHANGLQDAGHEDSPTVRLLLKDQVAWTRLVVDYVMFAAQREGKSFEDVPFLEPKSFSDSPQIYYPFRPNS